MNLPIGMTLSFDIKVRKSGAVGNGFAGCSRLNLLKVLHNRCETLGVKLNFGKKIEIENLETEFATSDIILASDGIGSAIREQYSQFFNPTITQKSNRFTWMGSTRKVEDFTYFFKDSKYGPICAHTYQYEEGMSTWVFEMSEDCLAKMAI